MKQNIESLISPQDGLGSQISQFDKFMQTRLINASGLQPWAEPGQEDAKRVITTSLQDVLLRIEYENVQSGTTSLRTVHKLVDAKMCQEDCSTPLCPAKCDRPKNRGL